MEQLLEQSENLLNETTLDFRRYIHTHIRWNNRLIGIKGARGTGKTTLLLQWLKEQNLSANKAAYFTLDDLYFSHHSLKQTTAAFYKQGGKILVLDEVHKYPNWSIEIKNIYDLFPGLKIVFTGSSIIDISRQQGDLSRRAVIYELQGLSFREYLSMKKIIDLPVIKFEELLNDSSQVKKRLPANFRPLEFFNEYLHNGYYPFSLEDSGSLHHRINQMVRAIVEYDMAELKDFDIRNAKKVLQLLYIIAQQVPFKPNLSSLAQKSSLHRNSLNNYLHYLEIAGLIRMLYPRGKSVAILQKPEKLFLNNATLQNNLAEGDPDKGSMRETFFLSQCAPFYKIGLPTQGDFIIDNKYTFEVGGKDKGGKQINKTKYAWLVKDDIVSGSLNTLPLWKFGMMY